MLFKQTSPIAALNRSLAKHRQQEHQLRATVTSTSSSTLRMLAAIDLVNVAKKIEAEEVKIRQYQTN